jgi:hypothetical protein
MKQILFSFLSLYSIVVSLWCAWCTDSDVLTLPANSAGGCALLREQLSTLISGCHGVLGCRPLSTSLAGLNCRPCRPCLPSALTPSASLVHMNIEQEDRFRSKEKGQFHSRRGPSLLLLRAPAFDRAHAALSVARADRPATLLAPGPHPAATRVSEAQPEAAPRGGAKPSGAAEGCAAAPAARARADGGAAGEPGPQVGDVPTVTTCAARDAKAPNRQPAQCADQGRWRQGGGIRVCRQGGRGREGG